MKIAFAAAAIVMAFLSLGLTGCSISYSIGKSSDSSKSISTSSSPGDSTAQAALQSDIRIFTAEAVRSDIPADRYIRRIGQIAEDHGITDWEREKAALAAIGAGLRQAGVAESAVADLEMLKPLTHHTATLELITEGYHS